MKQPILIFFASFMVLSEVSCFHHSHYRKRLKKNPAKRNSISKPPLPGSNDRETLKEALQLLNVGKKTLGLNTEDPELLLQLVENQNKKNKSESIEKILQDPKQIPHAPIGKQYLALSGEDGKVRVDNFTNVTPSPNEKAFVTSNGSDIQDVFKMVMEKKAPEAQSKVFHKITIIETNQLKPYSNKEPSHPTKHFKRKRRHRLSHWPRKFHVHSHTRQKRSRYFPMLNLFHRKHPTNLHETHFTQFVPKQTPKKINITNWHDSEDSSIEISLSKFSSPARVNKRLNGAKIFRETEDNFVDKVLFPSANDRFERKETIRNGREKSNVADDNLRFGDENLQKLIDSIGFESSLKTISITTPKVVIEENLATTVPIDKSSIATTTKASEVGIRDLFPALGVDRYALVERILPLKEGRESILSHILEVAAIMIITLLCFISILIVYSKLYKVSPTNSERTAEMRKEQATLKNQNIPDLNKTCPYGGMYYYKTVAMGEEDLGLLNLEWQSESGDWFSEIEEKEKI